MEVSNAQRRAEYLLVASIHRREGRIEQAERMEAEAAFRDRFPLELGWSPDVVINLERGELYPTPEVTAAMGQWLQCEQRLLAWCEPGQLPLPAGVLRPGAPAPGGGPGTPVEGVVLPGQVITSARTMAWWVVPAIGAAALALAWLAVGRRERAA